MEKFLVIAGVSIFVFLMQNRNKPWFRDLSMRLVYLMQPFPVNVKQALLTNFPYYRRLNSKYQQKFKAKANHIIRTKSFIGRGGMEVTPMMKLLIAGGMSQATLGFPGVVLRHFDKILIYPDQYYSTINRTYHQGEVNPRGGIIVFSWKSFMEGHRDTEDGINLGLHEIAHAIKLENIIKNDEFGFLNFTYLKQWQELAALEIKKIKAGEPHLFREYASANKHEFFAVAFENFFERSGRFANQHPELYQGMCRLLNQDPAHVMENTKPVLI